MFFFFFDETNGKKSKREFNNAKWQNKANQTSVRAKSIPNKYRQ